MYKNVTKHIRRYPLSVICIVIIWGLSLTPFFPETPLDNVKFIDKWTHFVMYGGLCIVIAWEYERNHRSPSLPHCLKRYLTGGWLAPVMMGGLLELLQAYATTTRNGDWLDFAANSVGATLGATIGWLYMKVRSRNS